MSKLKNFPILKNRLLIIWNAFHFLFPFVIGFIVRPLRYCRHIINSVVIARPGTLGFAGGVFNPGSIFLKDGSILLIAKAQIVPWFKARGKKRVLYMKGEAIFFILHGETMKRIKSQLVSNISESPFNGEYAIEDLRLFNWRGRTMINHSLIPLDNLDDRANQGRVFSVLSEFEIGAKALKLCAFPSIDFQTNSKEKNWVYKDCAGQLYLFYSINPYKVLALVDQNTFSFKTIVDVELNGRIVDPGGFGTMVSFSVNPIDFNEMYLLVIVHQIEFKYTGRCYFHWAVLIDKISFLPIKITSKPIFSGMSARGRLPGIRYISSILKRESEIIFFAGEGDVYVTATKKRISELNSLFIDI